MLPRYTESLTIKKITYPNAVSIVFVVLVSYQLITHWLKSYCSKLLWQTSVVVFNWNHFEMRLLNLRINFYLLRTFFPHLGRVFFVCVVSSFTTFRPNFTSGLLQVILLRPQIGMLSLVTVSPVITAFRQQLWKAVITRDTVTRLSIPIRGRGKITWRRPEVKFGRNVVKEETTQKTTKMRKKVRNK